MTFIRPQTMLVIYGSHPKKGGLMYTVHTVTHQWMKKDLGRNKGKGKAHSCTGTEALYRAYGP